MDIEQVKPNVEGLLDALNILRGMGMEPTGLVFKPAHRSAIVERMTQLGMDGVTLTLHGDDAYYAGVKLVEEPG